MMLMQRQYIVQQMLFTFIAWTIMVVNCQSVMNVTDAEDLIQTNMTYTVTRNNLTTGVNETVSMNTNSSKVLDSLKYELFNDNTTFTMPDKDVISANITAQIDEEEMIPDILKDFSVNFQQQNNQSQSLMHNNSEAGGFAADYHQYVVDGCPPDYVAVNGRCWISKSPYWIQVQSKFMQDYNQEGSVGDCKDDQCFRNVSAHRFVVEPRTGQNDLLGDLSVPNIVLTLWHDGPGDLQIFSTQWNDTLGVDQLRTIRQDQYFYMKSNMLGKVVFSVVHPDEISDEDALLMPLIKVHADFMPDYEAVAFPVNTAALHSLASIDPVRLQMYMQDKFNNTEVPSNGDIDAVASTMKSLILPILQSNIVSTDESHPRLLRRSLFEDLKRQKSCKAAYHPHSNFVYAQTVYSGAQSQRRISNDVQEPFEIRFNRDKDGSDGRVRFIKHTFKSIRKRQLEIAEYDRVQAGRKVRLHKRSFFSNLWGKIKTAAQSVGDVFKDVFVTLPKSFFNATAWKEGKNGFINSFNAGVKSAAVNSVEAMRDVIAVVPFGEMINKGLGIDDLVQAVKDCEVIFVTPIEFGLNLIIKGPKGTIELLVKQVQTLVPVLVGILKKIGLVIRDIFKFIVALFNWDDVLMNHKILLSHYAKMPTFIRTNVTGANGRFSNDLSSMVETLGNLSSQASTLFTTGQFDSFGSLVTTSNRQLYQNLTSNPALNTQFQGSGGPADIQGTYVGDIVSNNIGQLQADINPADHASFKQLASDTIKSMSDIMKNNASAILQEFKSLGNELGQRSWNFTAIFGTISRIFQYSIQILVAEALQVILLYFNLLLNIFDKIMSVRLRIPFITDFYEKVVTRGKAQLTLYGLFSLCAAVPVTVGFKMFNAGKNIFTEQEVNVLVATSQPEKYVDNLVDFAMQVPNQNSTRLRNMYRKSVSYILGSAYSVGQFLSALVGFVTDLNSVLFLIRMPFQFLSLMCNFPWSWYTDTLTTVGVNVRFIGWLTQFLGFLTGWMATCPQITGFPWGAFIGLLLSAVPNVYMIINVMVKDFILARDTDSKVEGISTVDILLKGLARLMMVLPNFLIVVPSIGMKVVSYVTIHQIILAGAAIHVGRLFIDMGSLSVYSTP
ncbi:hypothetical protein MP228_009948 [Amoeboaphelidium protococcarum]|nr:hypothetical protein MP228_009948 [Amoeboaphelidium protococcarum]